MKQAPIDKLLKRCPSMYKLVVVAAKRAKELNEGAPKLVQTDLKKVASIALEEIFQSRVAYKPEEAPGGESESKPRARSAPKSAEPAGAGAKKKKA